MTPQQILSYAPVACYLAANDIEKKKFSGKGTLDDMYAAKIKIIYSFINKIYTLDNNHTGIVATCNYLWELLGIYGLIAQQIVGGGGGTGGAIASPSSSTFGFDYMRRIYASDFTNGTDYVNSWIAGFNCEVYWNNTQIWLRPLTGQIRLTPSGFTVWIDDGNGNNTFDARTTNADVDMIVFKKFPIVAPPNPVTNPVIISYNLTQNTTITNISLANYLQDQVITFSIQANGYTYTWDTNFEFSNNWPVQPDANLVGTYSLYDFKVIGNRLVCISQSLNIVI